MLKASQKSLFILSVSTCIYAVIQILTLNRAYSEYLPLIFLSLLPLILISCKQNKLNIFEPPIILLMFCIYGGFIRVLSISLSGDTKDHLFQAAGNNSLLSGCFLFIFFNLFFAVGYSLAPKIEGSQILKIRIPKVMSYFLLGGLITIGGYLIHTFFTDFGIYRLLTSGNISSKQLLNVNNESSSASYLRLGETLFLSLFMVSYYKFKQGSKRLLPLIIASGLLVILFSIIVSSRSGILTIFIAYASIRNYFELKFLSPKIIAGVLSVILIFSFIATSRQSDQDLDFDIASSTSLLFEQLSRPQYSYTIDKAAMVTQMVPGKAPHLFGQSIMSPFFAPVPRFIWPGKPLIRYGPEFANQVLLDTRENTGVPPSFPVELFWNFGWAGVGLGGFLTGILSGNMNRKTNNALYKLRQINTIQEPRKIHHKAIYPGSNSVQLTSKQLPKIKHRSIAKSDHSAALSNTIFTLFFVRLFRADFSGAMISYVSMLFFIILFFSIFNQRESRHNSMPV